MILSDVFSIAITSFPDIHWRSYKEIIVLMIKENLIDISQTDFYFSEMVRNPLGSSILCTAPSAFVLLIINITI